MIFGKVIRSKVLGKWTKIPNKRLITAVITSTPRMTEQILQSFRGPRKAFEGDSLNAPDFC